MTEILNYQPAVDRVRKIMEQAEVTNDDIIWFNQLTDVFELTWHEDPPDFLPEPIKARIKKIQAVLETPIFPPLEATVCDLVYHQCDCGRSVEGEEALWIFEKFDGRCPHIGAIYDILLITRDDPQMADSLLDEDHPAYPLAQRLIRQRLLKVERGHLIFTIEGALLCSNITDLLPK